MRQITKNLLKTHLVQQITTVIVLFFHFILFYTYLICRNGVIQNTADFFNFSYFGLVRPRKINWMKEYELREFRGPQDNWRRFDHI